MHPLLHAQLAASARRLAVEHAIGETTASEMTTQSRARAVEPRSWPPPEQQQHAAKSLIDMGCLNGLRAVCSVAVVVFHCYLIWIQFMNPRQALELVRGNWFVRWGLLEVTCLAAGCWLLAAGCWLRQHEFSRRSTRSCSKTDIFNYRVIYTLHPSHCCTGACSLASVGGPIAVDFFLVLSAALATYQLLPQLEARGAGTAPPSCALVVLRYLRQRALRLLPSYAATVMLAILAIGPAEVPPEVAIARGFSFGQCPTGLWANMAFLSNFKGLGACGKPLGRPSA
jgi:hypothetical protein